MFSLILALPLINSLFLLMFGRKMGTTGSNILVCTTMLLTTLLSVFCFYDLVVSDSAVVIPYLTWVSFVLFNSNLSFYIDTLSGGMILVVNLISFLVHVYSTSYMRGDPHTVRFMSYLSLFTFFMLILVSSQNYLQLFIGWEGVGLCSYLLINFWYMRIQANKAAIKAMLVNRVGDASLIAGIVIMWLHYGSVNFLLVLPSTGDVVTFIIPLLLLIAAVGKSAQIGLHMWLPDAMEGPTPVSALIHAATMVTAGVYLIIRSSSIFEQSPTVLIITVIVGSITALFAATVGLAQNDIKKIIAYSTCSQLGFMVLSCGISYYSLALFHLVNHAFFKALLFLSAGSVIHSLLDEQDSRKMGGIIISQPLSYLFILVGSLALAGFPFLSGYYSKDLLLELSTKEYFVILGCWLGLSATLLTAFYSFKLISRTFLLFQNSPRVHWTKSHEGDWYLLGPLVILSLGSVFSGFYLKDSILGIMAHPVISSSLKLAPLILSLIGGTLGILLYIITKLSWERFFSLKGKFVYQFLVSAWDFDKVISYYLVLPIMKFGHKVTFKNFDTGLLEKLGPLGISNQIVYYSNVLSKIQSGYIFNYSVLIILFFSLFIVFS
uniref:NADH dehydrogenase subunit 5 n=1 Tax=Thysanostoma flagellatum TaxID=3287591 RepID=UPI001FA7AA58|nr:NADH dehydrogenase subunit 5 [Acromitus flagellatus]UMY76050.1 NADH dehydrogenase subunit 5 [Acromitus flagellatus]